MQYRTDIDGLRAIAILLVLIYHGGLALFPSGFVGVDVFFVISGFLITGIIHQSVSANNFSFLDFYKRRLWRLQPALICCMLFAMILTLLYFLPEDLIEFSRSARKTSLFISNLFFNKTTTGYFSPNIQELPLLHTWSLSIEWQCYFILPVLLYGLYAFCNKRMLLPLIGFTTGLCLVLSWHYSHEVPAQTYYQFSSRAFEFLIGACIALMPKPDFKLPAFLVNALGLMAVLSVIFVASRHNIALGYPNEYALLVCLAIACLIALGGWYPKALIFKLVGCRPLVFIGLISYSLYLWHWLIFSLLRYQGLLSQPYQLTLAYVSIFVLAFLSWKYIEKPSRKFKSLPFSYALIGLVIAPVIAIHSMDYLLKANQGFPQRFQGELVALYKQLDAYNRPSRTQCVSKDISTKERDAMCIIGSKHSKSKGLLIGDSFANHYWGFMETLAWDADIRILTQAVSSCMTLPGILHYDWWQFKSKVYTECRDKTAEYYQMINDTHYDYVFIGEIWSNYLSDSIVNKVGDERSKDLAKLRIKAALDKALQQIIASGAQPVLLKSTAIAHSNPLHCFYQHIKRRQKYKPENCAFTMEVSESEKWFNHLFNTMQAKYPKLILIDPRSVQCHKNHCPVAINGIPIYRDEVGHITDYASYQLGEKYLKKWGNPLKV